MISDYISLSSILINFEQVLKIEYSEMSTERIIRNAKSKLENSFQVTFNKSVYELQAENRLVADTLNIFLEQVIDALKGLSLYVDNCMFNSSVPIDLADVNYLGFDGNSIRVALRYLQSSKTYAQKNDIIIPLRAAVSNIEPCDIKRLFIILFMLDDLGIGEGAAVVAKLLYLGGLK